MEDRRIPPIVPAITTTNLSRCDTPRPGAVSNISNHSSGPNTPLSRRKWTEEEDNRLRALKVAGNKKWEEISVMFPGKTGNACRKRFTRLRNADARRSGRYDFAALDGEELARLRDCYFRTRRDYLEMMRRQAKVSMGWRQVESALVEFLPKWINDEYEAQLSEKRALALNNFNEPYSPPIVYNSAMLDTP